MRLLLVVIRFQLVLLLTAAAQGHELLAPEIVTLGRSFKLSCNAQSFADVLLSFTEVSALYIHRKTASMSTFELIAHLFYGSSGYSNYKTIPDYRKWTVNFLGSTTDNKNSIAINLQVLDAVCQDAGIYRCSMNYTTRDNRRRYKELTQNLTVEADVNEPTITADQGSSVGDVLCFDFGAKVKLRCTVRGPQFLVIVWKQEIKSSGSQDAATHKDAQHENDPVKNDITPTHSEPRYNQTDCPLFEYTSELGFQVSETDINRRYLCLVVLKGVDVARRAVLIDSTKKVVLPLKNFTAVGPSDTEAAVEASIGIGDIVTGMCVGVALLVFMIVALVYWKMDKSKGTYEKKPAPSPSRLDDVPSFSLEEPRSPQPSITNHTQEADDWSSHGSYVF